MSNETPHGSNRVTFFQEKQNGEVPKGPNHLISSVMMGIGLLLLSAGVVDQGIQTVQQGLSPDNPPISRSEKDIGLVGSGVGLIALSALPFALENRKSK